MSFEYIREMPKVGDIIESIPVPEDLKEVKRKRDEEIKSVFMGESDKFLVIIGPCSADIEDSVCEYVSRLARLQDEVKEKLILIPRIYTNKPRTTGEGYKGMAHQPKPSGASNMVEGLKAIRKMHIRAIKESHLTAADEMLYPGNYPYLEDILSYVAVGARSVENQLHRLTISGLNIPSGMKNPTSGDLEVMLNSVQAAQLSHVFVYNGWEVETSGNPLSHSILRGAVDQHGMNIPNYHYEDLMRVAELYGKRDLQYPAIIVDTNHANSNKQFQRQPRIAREVMRSRNHSKTIRNMVKGLMIESYLVDGTQKISEENVYGKSITDPCLGWDDSERLVRDLSELL